MARTGVEWERRPPLPATHYVHPAIYTDEQIFREEQEKIDTELGLSGHMRRDYEAKVSRLGSDSVGTYWPKDVTRNLGLRPHDIARIHIIARNVAVVTFEKPQPAASQQA